MSSSFTNADFGMTFYGLYSVVKDMWAYWVCNTWDKCHGIAIIYYKLHIALLLSSHSRIHSPTNLLTSQSSSFAAVSWLLSLYSSISRRPPSASPVPPLPIPLCYILDPRFSFVWWVLQLSPFPSLRLFLLSVAIPCDLSAILLYHRMRMCNVPTTRLSSFLFLFVLFCNPAFLWKSARVPLF